ncbi:MAG: peptidylprolyl isomerase [Marinilabiliaceae bacterium]|nr:peptidylprolyl isomerase [Marinilabiliaceae bacterium]
MKKILFAISIFALMLISCSQGADYKYVTIHTTYGDIVIELFDDTPNHSRNFANLAASGQYDSLLFHRVINGFMIQGGDPDSRNAGAYDELGHNEIGSKIDAEILFPKHFHRRGAVAAARNGDSSNPERKSSGSQFYIVQGNGPLADYEVNEAEEMHMQKLRQKIFYEIQPKYQDSLAYYQKHGMQEQLVNLQITAMGEIEARVKESGEFHYPDEVREVYKREGGAPHLDGSYTVFGQVVRGMDVVDSIAHVMVNINTQRPVDDVRFSMTVSNSIDE